MKKLIYLIAVFSTPVFATQTIECKFTSLSDKNGHYNKIHELTFLLDNSDKKTYMKTKTGTKKKVEYINSNVKTFLERNMFSNIVAMTTIDNKMNAVHSRHPMMFSMTTPLQYYGSCTKK